MKTTLKQWLAGITALAIFAGSLASAAVISDEVMRLGGSASNDQRIVFKSGPEIKADVATHKLKLSHDGITYFTAGDLTSVLANTHILVGNASNVATDVAASGDVSLANTGAFTVNSVGTSSSANLHSAELLANAATSSNTASTIVKRDSSGNFSAGTITAGQLIDSGLTATTVPYANGSKQLTSSAVTPTELGYLSGVTSALQTQIDAKLSTALTSAHLHVGNGSNVATDVAASGDLSLTNTGAFTVNTVGGSSAANIATAEALANAATSANTANAIVKRGASGQFTAGTITAGQLVDSGLTASTVPYADSGKQLTSSAVTPTELGYLSGVTSALQTQINTKLSTSLTTAHLYVGNGSNVATDVAASGDVSLANTGAFTVNTVGGSSAANIASAEALANAATSANTVSTIVKRDSSGNFSAGAVTTTTINGGNIRATANTISSTNSNGDINLTPNGTGKVVTTATSTVGQLIDSGLTASTVPYADSSKQLTSSAVTPTELGYLSGVTSAIQTQFTGKLSTSLTSAHLFVGNGSAVATDVAASGDVTLANTGAFTVASVGGSSASNVNAATVLANNATDANTASQIVRRDASGNFSAGAVTTTTINGGNIRATSNTISSTNTNGNINLSPNGTGKNVLSGLSYPTADGSSGQVLSTNGAGVLSFVNSGSSASSGRNLNYGFSVSVASNAMTINLKQEDGSTDPTAGSPAIFKFRNTSATSGATDAVSVTGALSVVISSGATLGHASARAEPIYIYLINNGGTAELAVSSSSAWDEAQLQSTTVMNSSSDDRYTMYSTTARTTKPILLIGKLLSNQTTAGTYTATPTLISRDYEDMHNRGLTTIGDNRNFAMYSVSYGNGAIDKEWGQWTTDAAHPSTGNYTMTIDNGVFADKPNCTISTDSGEASINPTSATNVTFQLRTSGGTLQNGTAFIICHGPSGNQ